MDSGLNNKRKVDRGCNDSCNSKILCTNNSQNNQISPGNLLERIPLLNVEQLKSELRERGCRRTSGRKKDLQNR